MTAQGVSCLAMLLPSFSLSSSLSLSPSPSPLPNPPTPPSEETCDFSYKICVQSSHIQSIQTLVIATVIHYCCPEWLPTQGQVPVWGQNSSPHSPNSVFIPLAVQHLQSCSTQSTLSHCWDRFPRRHFHDQRNNHEISGLLAYTILLLGLLPVLSLEWLNPNIKNQDFPSPPPSKRQEIVLKNHKNF